MKMTGRACVRKRVLATLVCETRASSAHRSDRTQLYAKRNKAAGVELKNTLARVFTHSAQHSSAGGPNCEPGATITPTLAQTSGSAEGNGTTTTGGEDHKVSEVARE